MLKFLKNHSIRSLYGAAGFELSPFDYYKQLKELFTKYHHKEIGNLLLNLLDAALSILREDIKKLIYLS